MPKLSIHAGHPVRLQVPGRLGSTTCRAAATLVLDRVRGIVHFEIGIFRGETLAFVTVQPLTDYSAEDAMRELRKIAQDLNVDGPEVERAG